MLDNLDDSRHSGGCCGVSGVEPNDSTAEGAEDAETTRSLNSGYSPRPRRPLRLKMFLYFAATVISIGLVLFSTVGL